MSDVLTRIKRAVLAGDIVFTVKARVEMRVDGLAEMDVIESIINAVAIQKKIRSTSEARRQAREYLYIIVSTNLNGMPIYTKGKLVSEAGRDTYYGVQENVFPADNANERRYLEKGFSTALAGSTE